MESILLKKFRFERAAAEQKIIDAENKKLEELNKIAEANEKK